MENGYTHEIPRSVNIRNEKGVDYDTLQTVLEDFKNVLTVVSSDVKELKSNQQKMEVKMKPVISFYRKVLTIVAFCAATYTLWKTGVFDWIKKIF